MRLQAPIKWPSCHTDEAVRSLKAETHILYDRGISGALCLWPNTSVDLDEAFARAFAVIRTSGTGIEAVRSLLPTEPHRRYGVGYVETGALRHFEVQYVPVERTQAALTAAAESARAADGRIIVVLSETARQRDSALNAIWMRHVAAA